MKIKRLFVVAIASLLVASSSVLAQSPERRGPGGDGPPPNPVMEALDKDRDHTISSNEIETAASSLKSLDADGNGELSGSELRPNHDRRGRSGRANEDARRGPQGRRAGGPNPTEIMNHAFQFDANGDGLLSRQELQSFIQEMVARETGRPDRRPPRGEQGAGQRGQQRPDRPRRQR